MEEFLGYSYKLTQSENFDEFMKALGLSSLHRKIGASVQPVVKLTRRDQIYTLLTTSIIRNHEISFQSGIEFDEETPDGRKVKSTIIIDGNKMIHTQKSKNNTTTITSEYKSHEMVSVLTIGNIVCTRVYEKVA